CINHSFDPRCSRSEYFIERAYRVTLKLMNG
ncbi:MAG: hypothetical protein ACI9TP_001051, partial [Candidatus Azotimanducaceae bacterium]